MKSAFISHSAADQSFVNLLVSLLEFHGLEVWCSQSHLKPGDNFRAEIKAALQKSDALILVATQNAANSKWVTKELVTFMGTRSESIVIPLKLSELPPQEVLDDLRDLQWVDFHEDMLSGFQQLLALFGRDFLDTRQPAPPNRRAVERRDTRGRRDEQDRRKPLERRRVDLRQRVRRGFWKAVHQATGMNPDDELPASVRTRFKIVDALKPEIQRYQITNEAGKALAGDSLLETSLERVWREMEARGTRRAIYVIEALAEDLFDRYSIAPLERRAADRRANERRDGERRSRTTGSS